MKAVFVAARAVTPSKIVCIGRNYAEHARELGNDIPEEPVVFIKPPSAISSVLHAELGEPIHYEAELCFMVVKRKLAAVAVGLDLTKRATQTKLKAKGLPWERAKAFDGSALFGEFVACDSSEGLGLKLLCDDKLLQQGDVSQMLFSPEALLEHVLSFMTLEDGDILMTGTPAGVGALQVDGHYHAELWKHDHLVSSVSWRAR